MTSPNRFKKRYFFLVLGAFVLGVTFWSYSTPSSAVMTRALEIQEAKPAAETHFSPAELSVEKEGRLPASK